MKPDAVRFSSRFIFMLFGAIAAIMLWAAPVHAQVLYSRDSEARCADDRYCRAIVSAYIFCLGRNPLETNDEGSVQHWISWARSNSIDRAREQICRSGEAQALRRGGNQGLTAANCSSSYTCREIQSTYLYCLGRDPLNADFPSLSYWTGMIDNGWYQSSQIKAAICSSPEGKKFASATPAADPISRCKDSFSCSIVRGYYVQYLGRDPYAGDRTGLLYWMSQIDRGTMTIDTARRGVSLSGEAAAFRARNPKLFDHSGPEQGVIRVLLGDNSTGFLQRLYSPSASPIPGPQVVLGGSCMIWQASSPANLNMTWYPSTGSDAWVSSPEGAALPGAGQAGFALGAGVVSMTGD